MNTVIKTNALLLNFFLSVLSGFLLVMTIPGTNAPLAAWIALVPAILNLNGSSFTKAFFFSFLTGFLYFSSLHLWANVFGWEVWLASSLVHPICAGMWGGLASLCLTNKYSSSFVRIFVPAGLWVIFEHFKTLGVLGVNWGSLAYSQYQCIELIQIAGITGMYGITFLLAFSSSLISELIRLVILKQQITKLHILIVAAFVIILISVIKYGALVIHEDETQAGTSIRIGIVQPSFEMAIKTDPYYKKFMLAHIINLIRQCEKERPDIIILPETSIPYALPNRPMQLIMSKLAKDVRTPIVYGAITINERQQTYNSAVLYDSYGKVSGIYSKRKLVPFGEYLPLPDSWRTMHKQLKRIPNFTPGTQLANFSIKGQKFGAIICFESDFPAYVTEAVNHGSKFIVALTNDAWFENYSVAENHVSWNAIRAAESHAPIIQSANAGISAIINRNGKILKRIELFNRAVMCEEIKLLSTGSFYAKNGEIFLVACYFITLLAMLTIVLNKTQKTEKT